MSRKWLATGGLLILAFGIAGCPAFIVGSIVGSLGYAGYQYATAGDAKNDTTAATECATDAVAERHRMIVIVGRDWPASVLPGRLRWKKNLTLLSR